MSRRSPHGAFRTVVVSQATADKLEAFRASFGFATADALAEHILIGGLGDLEHEDLSRYRPDPAAVVPDILDDAHRSGGS